MKRFTLLVTATLALLAPVAQADPRFPETIEQLTVGHFRMWDDTIQTGYVMGVYSFATYNGLVCPGPISVGEFQAGLIHNMALQNVDSLPKAMLALFLRDGCRVK